MNVKKLFIVAGALSMIMHGGKGSCFNQGISLNTAIQTCLDLVCLDLKTSHLELCIPLGYRELKGSLQISPCLLKNTHRGWNSEYNNKAANYS